MATYTELRDLFSDDAMKNKVDVAVVIAANNLITGTPTADEQKWAAAVLAQPRGEADKAYRAMLAENNSASVSTIQNATDATIQNAVNNVVDSLVIAYNAI